MKHFICHFAKRHLLGKNITNVQITRNDNKHKERTRLSFLQVKTCTICLHVQCQSQSYHEAEKRTSFRICARWTLSGIFPGNSRSQRKGTGYARDNTFVIHSAHRTVQAYISITSNTPGHSTPSYK